MTDTDALTRLQAALVMAVLAAAILSAGYMWALSNAGGRRRLVVSTTTSLFDTGLLDTLEDRFEREYDVDLHFIPVGTGLAIQHARRGDADAILIHAPSKELELMEDGHGVARKIIAYNFFAVVGPSDDPAAIENLPVTQALTKIREKGEKGDALWVSRGDDSGTHTKERQLWTVAGLDAEQLRGEPWYIESGTGMGKTLQVANEKRAYTLADAGTYFKYFKDGLIQLEVLVGKGKELLNVYSVVAVNPDRHSKTSFEAAVTLIDFLISDEAQGVIGEYGLEEYGRPLFYPAVELLRQKGDSQLVAWIKASAYFEGSECPPRYRHGLDELYP